MWKPPPTTTRSFLGCARVDSRSAPTRTLLSAGSCTPRSASTEAFRGRGKGDFQESHDLEDVLTVLAGLRPLRAEVVEANTSVATAVRRELIELGANDSFVDAVPGHFEGDAAGQARADVELAWLASLRETAPSGGPSPPDA